jgi:hypothetical protein
LQTTELFAEQVLIGLLVVLMTVLVFFDRLHTFYKNHVGSKDYLEQIVAGGFILGAAYLIGMVYDRVVDTMLQDLESHCRLQFGLQNFGRRKDGVIVLPSSDPFDERKYRIAVLENTQANEYMEYLRSRIRLTRALATTLPGITLAVLLQRTHSYPGPTLMWTIVAATLPIAYGLVLGLKLFLPKEPFERPPKTDRLEDVHNYMKRAGMLGDSHKERKSVVRLLWPDEVWICWLLLTIAGSILILSSGICIRFWWLIAGLVLTAIVGWSWWRISITFYAFLSNYNEYGPRKSEREVKSSNTHHSHS